MRKIADQSRLFHIHDYPGRDAAESAQGLRSALHGCRVLGNLPAGEHLISEVQISVHVGAKDERAMEVARMPEVAIYRVKNKHKSQCLVRRHLGQLAIHRTPTLDALLNQPISLSLD